VLVCPCGDHVVCTYSVADVRQGGRCCNIFGNSLDAQQQESCHNLIPAVYTILTSDLQVPDSFDPTDCDNIQVTVCFLCHVRFTIPLVYNVCTRLTSGISMTNTFHPRVTNLTAHRLPPVVYESDDGWEDYTSSDEEVEAGWISRNRPSRAAAQRNKVRREKRRGNGRGGGQPTSLCPCLAGDGKGTTQGGDHRTVMTVTGLHYR
jgi:hypothetical protein